jgi:hypothetical protein
LAKFGTDDAGTTETVIDDMALSARLREPKQPPCHRQQTEKIRGFSALAARLAGQNLPDQAAREKFAGKNCRLYPLRPHEYRITPSSTLPKRKVTMSSA